MLPFGAAQIFKPGDLLLPIMKKYLFLFFVVFAASKVFAQEADSTPVHVSLYPNCGGTYKGKAPCEECKVIESELELEPDTDSSGHYFLIDKYIAEKGTDIASRRKGDWLLVNDVFEGKKVFMVVLDFDFPDKSQFYLLQKDGNLQPLDKDKKKIQSTIDMLMKKQ